MDPLVLAVYAGVGAVALVAELSSPSRRWGGGALGGYYVNGVHVQGANSQAQAERIAAQFGHRARGGRVSQPPPSEWSVEAEPEVEAWLMSLSSGDFGRVELNIDRLERSGVLLGYPHTSQLRGKLRELRFHLGTQDRRIAYFVASGRRIILLTVFRKTGMRESDEVDRAYRAMLTCEGIGHTAEDDDDG